MPWPSPRFIPDTGGCIVPHADGILVCWELLTEPPPSQVTSSPNPSWLHISNLFLVGLVSCNQEFSSIMLVILCWMLVTDPSVVHVQASEVFILWECCQWFVAQFYLASPHLLACLSRRRLNCFFAICDEQCPVFSLTLLSEATALHCIKGSRELLIGTVLS